MGQPDFEQLFGRIARRIVVVEIIHRLRVGGAAVVVDIHHTVDRHFQVTDIAPLFFGELFNEI